MRQWGFKERSGDVTGLDMIPRWVMLRHSFYFEWPFRWVPPERGDIFVIHHLFKDEMEDLRYHNTRSVGPNMRREPTASHNGNGYFPVEGQIVGRKGRFFPRWLYALLGCITAFGFLMMLLLDDELTFILGLTLMVVGAGGLALLWLMVRHGLCLAVISYKGGVEQTVERSSIQSPAGELVQMAAQESLKTRVELKIMLSMYAMTKFNQDVIVRDADSLQERIDYVLRSVSGSESTMGNMIPAKYMPLLISRRWRDFEGRFPPKETFDHRPPSMRRPTGPVGVPPQEMAPVGGGLGAMPAPVPLVAPPTSPPVASQGGPPAHGVTAAREAGRAQPVPPMAGSGTPSTPLPAGPQSAPPTRGEPAGAGPPVARPAKCARCGASLAPETAFCTRCGMPTRQ